MRRIPGISLLEFRARARESLYLERLVISLANFLAHAYHSPPPPPLPLGKIGRSLASRLKLLATNLPSRFRPRARYLLDNLEVVTTLPWVLTHGDLVPGNMMVDASSGRLTGLVDWAEAEVLPFGVCFYGVEEVLGGMTEGGWRWWNEVEVERLRGLFWRELGVGEEVRGRVEMARDVGVLLVSCFICLVWSFERFEYSFYSDFPLDETMLTLNTCSGGVLRGMMDDLIGSLRRGGMMLRLRG